MGSSPSTYENNVINHTFEPLTPILLLLFSIACLVGSIYFYYYTQKQLSPAKPTPPPVKKEPKLDTVKSSQDITVKYSDQHLVVTSNMNERLKLFENKK